MSGVRKPSLFALKMQKLRDAENTNPPDRNVPSSASDVNKTIEISSMKIRERIMDVNSTQKIQSDGAPMDVDDPDKNANIPDYTEIHEENLRKLANMSEDEIQRLQHEVLQVLKPTQVEFLRKKRKAKFTTGIESKFEQLSTKVPATDVQLELKDKGIHMDLVEQEKLKWMEDVPSINHPFPKSFNARFDFDGSLLPFVEENKSTSDRGLYHHGEEPQRPGYSIEELYQLSRSAVPGQRIFALNTIAAILEKEYILADHLETPLLKQLIESGIFLVLRFSLDERIPSVSLVALRAISALLWKPLDMHYLSDMVGIFGDLKLPTFEVPIKELTSENMDELKDIEMLKLDLIKGALRTEIVQRFRYILDIPNPEVENILSIIKCLTRISYHSYDATVTILRTDSLLELLFEKCQLPMYSDKLCIAKLMILLRVIACRHRDFALQLDKRLNLTQYILRIIADIVTKTSTASQCIYLWNVLLHHNIGEEAVLEFSQVFVSLLNQLHRINEGNMKSSEIIYATALITLFTHLFKKFYESIKFLINPLESLCCQWINVFIKEPHGSREFSKLISNSIYLLNDIQVKNSLHLARFNTQMKVLTNVNIYDKLTRNFRKTSYILNVSKKGNVECLPSLCVPLSVLNTNNGLVVVHSIVKYGFQHGCHAFVSNIFNDEIWRYIDSILKHPEPRDYSEQWCARYEIHFLCDLLKLCSKWNVFLERKLVQLAFTLIRIIHSEDAYLVSDIFSEVVFNKKIYDQWLTDDNYVTDILSDLENMKQYFLKELNISRRVPDDLISTTQGIDYALSTDWHYVPILKISNNKNTEIKASAESIKAVLKWIYLIEYFSDDIRIDISLAARYCRVACVFLCGDVFLDVDNILQAILRRLLIRNEDLDFKKEIPGISSFYDFYRELCEQFASSSYCNPVFGMYVLVPLQQRHDCQYRKYVWMEQPIVLKFLNVQANQLLVPMECYLEPCEKDLQLVEVYLRHLAVGTVKKNINPVCYSIGLHHIATVMRNRKDDFKVKILMEKIDKLGNQSLRDEIMYYAHSEEMK